MTASADRRIRPLPGEVHSELVESLYATRTPPAVMSALFALVGGQAFVLTRDPVLRALVLSGVAASAVRLLVLFRDRARLRGGRLGDRLAAERRFAICYLVFAGLLGAFVARVFGAAPPALHLPAAVLLVGYAAGVAAGTALRPAISVPALVLAVVPPAVTAAATGAVNGSAVELVTAVSLLAFLAGGARSMLERYRSTLAAIALRRAHAETARTDPLTGLPNRLGLAERFGAVIGGARPDAPVAVHYMDLDDFKAVNDRMGHPAGDALLRLFAERLARLAGPAGIAARLGGDEFVLVRTGPESAGAPEALAEQAAAALSDRYWIAGRVLTVSASVGCAVAPARAASLDDLLRSANRPLHDRKGQHRLARGRAAEGQRSA